MAGQRRFDKWATDPCNRGTGTAAFANGPPSFPLALSYALLAGLFKAPKGGPLTSNKSADGRSQELKAASLTVPNRFVA